MTVVKRYIKMIWGFINYGILKATQLAIISNADVVFFFPYYHMGGAEQVHLDIVSSVKNKNVVVIFTHKSATAHLLPAFKEVATVIELNHIINKKSTWITSLLFSSISKTINKSSKIKSVLGCNTTYYYSHVVPKVTKRKLDLIHAFAPNDDRLSQFISTATYIDDRIVINEKAKQILVDQYALARLDKTYASRITIIGNGVPVSQDTLDNPSIDSSEIKIGFVGRWSDEKRPELYLSIANHFKNTHAIKWFIAGSGFNQKTDIIGQHGVESLGAISNPEELTTFYKSLHFICITSIYEGFPMVVMEAMTYGVIPICTNVGVISEHIVHGKNGFLIDSMDRPELAIQNDFVTLIANLLTKPDELVTLSMACKSYARTHFSIERFQQAYNKLLT